MSDAWNEKMSVKDKRNMFLVFLIAFIPRVILCLIYAEPLRTPMDEMSTIATGAYFGGTDFTALTSAAGFYYGGGFSIFFAPFFRMGLETIVIYKIMLVTCSLLQAMIGPMAYYMLRKGFAIKNRNYAFAGALACSYMVVTRAMEMYNEHMLIFIAWCVAFTFLKLCQHKDNYKWKSIYSCILVFVLCYGLTIHTRYKILFIGIAMLLVIFYWIYRRLLVAGIPTIISMVIFYNVATAFNQMVQNKVWLVEPGDKLKNTSTGVLSMLYWLDDVIGWNAIGSTIIGQMNTVFIMSGGMLLMGVVIFLYYFLINGKSFLYRKDSRVYGMQNQNHWEEFYMALAIMFLLCIGGTIFAHGVRWLPKTVAALGKAAYGSGTYGYKAFTYIRYIGPLLGPFMLAVVGAIYHLKDHLRKVLPWCVCAYACMQLFWLAFVVPHIARAKVASEVFWPFSLGKTYTDPIRARYYFFGTVIAALVFMILILCYRMKKIILPLGIVFVFMGYQYIYDAVAWDAQHSDKFVKQVNAGYELLSDMDEIYDMPEYIYVKDNRKGIYTYQFLFGSDYKVLWYSDAEGLSDAIVLSTQKADEKLLEAGYKWTKLDKNEYLYVIGEKYQVIFEQEGYQFSE